MRQATYASVVVAVALIVAKLAAWAITDSVAMLSALMDSILDALASIINLFAVRHALQPADREHRFGHGKAEALAGLAQAAFISGSAVFLIIEAAQRFARPAEGPASSIAPFWRVMLRAVRPARQNKTICKANGGHGWTRTTDLTLIRRVL